MVISLLVRAYGIILLGRADHTLAVYCIWSPPFFVFEVQQSFHHAGLEKLDTTGGLCASDF
jgi:hypothetical protein